jgi:hypothetical protein
MAQRVWAQIGLGDRAWVARLDPVIALQSGYRPAQRGISRTDLVHHITAILL